MRRSERITKDALRVAALAIVALAILTFAIIKLGNAARLFTRRYSLYAFLPNASGLREGGQVTVAGQLAGSIAKIEFLPVDADTMRNLRITVQIDEKLQQQVRFDSRVTLRNQGLLGDRFFDITPGTPRFRPLHNGDTLQLGTSVDYDVMIQRAASVLADVAGLTHDLRGLTQSVARGVYRDLEFVERAEFDRLEVPFTGPQGVLAGVADERELHVASADSAGECDRFSFELDGGPRVADRHVEAESHECSRFPGGEALFHRQASSRLDESDPFDRTARLREQVALGHENLDQQLVQLLAFRDGEGPIGQRKALVDPILAESHARQGPE